MKVFAIVPVKKFENSKTRLSDLLSPEDRIRLSALMLEETLAVLSASDRLEQIVVVSADHAAGELARAKQAVFLHEEKENGVNSAVRIADSYCVSHGADASIVIPQDLPLLDSVELSKACDFAEREKQCVVIVPSVRYDGTNLLLRKPPDVIPTFYDNNSYEGHRDASRKKGVEPKVFLSGKLMIDVDTADDVRRLARDGVAHKSRVLEFFKEKDAQRTA